jgi:hypothetical protein
MVHDHRGPHIALECSLPSAVTTISPFVDKFILLLKNCGCVPEGVSEEGGAVIHMRKSTGEAPKLLAKDAQENSTKWFIPLSKSAKYCRTGDRPWRAVSGF